MLKFYIAVQPREESSSNQELPQNKALLIVAPVHIESTVIIGIE